MSNPDKARQERGPLSFPVAPVAFAAAALAGALLHVAWPLPWLGSPLADILLAIGAIGILAGGGLIYGALAALSRAGTTAHPGRASEHLLTTGPFRLTRNPIYLGLATIVAGAGFLLGIVWLILAAVAGALIVGRFAVRPEEDYLAQRFGKRYRDYQKTVRRWI